MNDPSRTTFIGGRLNTIEMVIADGVTARFNVGGEPTPNRVLVLTDTQPLTIPDDHGQTTLRLVGIHGDMAQIAYLSEFDHRSFGNNLVTVDGGVVELPISTSTP